MTPQERAVIEAAVAWGEAPMSDSAVEANSLAAALRALRDARAQALPADPQAQGEAVELEMVVWEDTDDGEFVYARPGGKMDHRRGEYHNMRRLGTVRLPLTPASVEKS